MERLKQALYTKTEQAKHVHEIIPVQVTLFKGAGEGKR